MFNYLAVVATAAITFAGLLHLLVHYTQDAAEPPLLFTSLPFIKTMIGLTRKKSKYYVELRQTARDILNTNVNGDEGFWGYSITFYKAMHIPLSPGPELDAMNRVMAQKVTVSIDRLQGERSVGLFDFIRHEITLATTDSVYGPKNPFQDPAVENAFWKFQPGIMIVMMGLFPSILARESLAAREIMTKAFIKYFGEDSYKNGSALIQARYEHSTEHKLPLEDIARFEVGDCRNELSKVIFDDITTTEYGETVKVRTIDISQVKSSCPILLSTLQEVLRLHTIGISTRLVMEDHMLDGKYLLKKGSIVMIPGPVQHTDASVWGPSVNEFDHLRFLPKNKRHNATAFRGFGGGTTLCPGRHFASTKIFAFTAMLISRFDITPVNGKWVQLTTDKAALWETTPVPDNDIEVKISPRTLEDISTKWKIIVSGSDKAMPLSAEDL